MLAADALDKGFEGGDVHVAFEGMLAATGGAPLR